MAYGDRIKQKYSSLTKAKLIEKILSPLNIREMLFIKEFTDKDSPGFLCQSLAYKIAFNQPNPNVYRAEGWRYMQRAKVRMAVKEQLEAMGLKDLLNKAYVKIVKGYVDGEKEIRPKDVTAVGDITHKLCGDYAPEKHLNFNLTEADRDAEYSKIIDKIREAQAKRGLSSPMPAMVSVEPKVPTIKVRPDSD